MTDTEQNHTTLHGLHEWFRHTFEKAGWMVLAKHRLEKDKSYQNKLDSYLIGIKRLKKYLKARQNNSLGNETIVRDFPHMIKNLDHLKSFVKSLSTANLSHNTVKSSDDVVVEDMTLCAMQHYYKHMFEKYGWMVLTKSKLNHGDYDKKPALKSHKESKLKMYGESLEVLLQSLIYRMETCNDVDKNNVQVDLASMIRNVNVLKSCFNTHLMKEARQVVSEISSDSQWNLIQPDANSATSTMVPADVTVSATSDVVPSSPRRSPIRVANSATSTMVPEILTITSESHVGGMSDYEKIAKLFRS